MKTVKEVLSKMEDKAQSSESCKISNTPTKADIEKLWLMMTGLFGEQWTRSYGDVPDPLGVWRAALKGVSWNLITFGLSRMAESGAKYPPSAPEFRSLCVIKKHWEHARMDNVVPQERRISSKTKEERDEIARDNLKKMRDMLSGR